MADESSKQRYFFLQIGNLYELYYTDALAVKKFGIVLIKGDRTHCGFISFISYSTLQSNPVFFF